MEQASSFSAGDMATWVAVAIAFALGIFSIWQYRKAERVRESKDFLDAATRRLEQAYSEMADRRSTEWMNLPAPDRLLWLSVARMIREGENTANQITEKSHQVLYEHAQTFWRGKLYDLLLPLNKVPLTYFAETPDKALVQLGDDRAPISPKSLRVILDFSKWPKDTADPLQGVGEHSAEEIDRMQTFGPRSVGDYLDALDAMHSDSEPRKDHWRREWDKPRA